MLTVLRRSQGLWVAIVVLGMTASVAFAGAGGVPGSPNSAWNRGQTADSSDAPESEAPESEAPESEAPESQAPESPDANTNSTDNHGALVSTAANMDTPDGFANHGAFVSCVAHMDVTDVATFDWTTVTPESCGQTTLSTDGLTTTSHGHGHGHSNAKHHGGRPD